MPEITVHHLERSRGLRVVWLLEELGLPYTLTLHRRHPVVPIGTLAAVSPLARSPIVVVDGDVLTESGSIIPSLLQTYATSSSSLESEPSASSTWWSHFSEGSLMLFLHPAHFLGLGARNVARGMTQEEKRGADRVVGWFNLWSAGHVQRGLDVVEEWLERHEWFSGTERLGEGDFMMAFVLYSIAHGGPPGKPAAQLGPASTRWLAGVRARPAWRRTEARIALAEGEAKL